MAGTGTSDTSVFSSTPKQSREALTLDLSSVHATQYSVSEFLLLYDFCGLGLKSCWKLREMTGQNNSFSANSVCSASSETFSENFPQFDLPLVFLPKCRFASPVFPELFRLQWFLPTFCLGDLTPSSLTCH